MVLILRKDDLKLISCSTKKFVCHESVYTLPLNCSSSTLRRCILQLDVVGAQDTHGQPEEVPPEEIKDSVKPSHILSTKSMSSHTIPVPNTSGPLQFRAPTKLDESAQSQSPSQGEGVVSPEHLAYSNDLATGLEDLKQRVAKQVEDPGIRQKILNSLTKAGDSVSNIVERGQLKVGKGDKNQISSSNVVMGKRTRKEVELVQPQKEHQQKKQKTYDKIRFHPGDAISVCVVEDI